MIKIIGYIVRLVVDYLHDNPVVLQKLKEALGIDDVSYSIMGRSLENSITENMDSDCIVVVPEGLKDEVVSGLTDFFSSLDDGKKRLIVASDSLKILRM